MNGLDILFSLTQERMIDVKRITCLEESILIYIKNGGFLIDIIDFAALVYLMYYYKEYHHYFELIHRYVPDEHI